MTRTNEAGETRIADATGMPTTDAQPVYPHTMRLQRFLARAGVASRRGSEDLMTAGRVTVNGCVAQLGAQADPETDVICIDGRPLPSKAPKRYIMLNKPRGYVTTLHDERGRKTVADLVASLGERLYPVGRLDYDSEGLLLLTNDGELAQRLTHPSCEVDKVYLARVTGNPSNDALDRLRRGMYMEGDERRTYPAQVRVVRDESLFSDILVTIHEGRNRQVRRMFDSVGHKVLLLRRVRFGPLELGDLRRGEWRELSAEEIARLKAL